MRVFVTGASGYIGYAVAKAFRRRGHVVWGLVRTGEKGDPLSLEEIYPVIGDLQNPESYEGVLNEVEVVVHCAFESSEKAVERDKQTLDFILGRLSKSHMPRTFIYTSGVWVYGDTGLKVVDEATELNPIELVKWRPSHEDLVLKATTPNLRTVVIRPGIVYGGTGGLLDTLFHSVQSGAVSVIDNGTNHWSMVHRQDLARAYVLAAEKELNDVTLNIADDARPTFRGIAEAVARAAGIPDQIRSLNIKEAINEWGIMGWGLVLDQQISNQRAKRLLDWHPFHGSFINNVEVYYNSWKIGQMVQGF